MTPTHCHSVRFLLLSLTHHCLCHLILYDLLLLNESVSRWSLRFVFQLASLLKAYQNISTPKKFISHTHRNTSLLTLTVQVCGSYLWEGAEKTELPVHCIKTDIIFSQTVAFRNLSIPDASKVSFESISSRRYFLV